MWFCWILWRWNICLKLWKNDNRYVRLIFGAAFFTCRGVYHSFQTRFYSIDLLDRFGMLPTKSILISALLPFILSFICYIFSRPFLLRAIYCFKCYLFAFVLGLFFTMPGADFWPLNSLILWCSFPSVLLLHWFVFRHAFGFQKSLLRDLFLCIGLAVTSWLLYTYCVVPAVNLIK